MIRIYTVNNNWKPFSRYHQFHKAFKNGLYGFTDTRFRFSKVRFLKHRRICPKKGGYYEF